MLVIKSFTYCFNPNQGGGHYGPPYHMFAYCAKVLLIAIFRVSRLFLTIIYGHFKKKMKVFRLSDIFLWPFLSRRSWILPNEKMSRQFFLEKSRFANGCKIFIFPRKRLGKVAMSHKLVAFEYFNEK